MKQHEQKFKADGAKSGEAITGLQVPPDDIQHECTHDGQAGCAVLRQPAGWLLRSLMQRVEIAGVLVLPVRRFVEE